MKKYTLIKEYPGSVKSGTIVKLDELGQYVTDNIIIFQKEYIESYPEFWKEVVSEVVLTTHDKVELYEGQPYAVVNITENKAFTWDMCVENGFRKGQRKYDHLLYFSTIEAAQEYVDRFKPKYSIDDIITTFDNPPVTYDKHDIITMLTSLKKT